MQFHYESGKLDEKSFFFIIAAALYITSEPEDSSVSKCVVVALMSVVSVVA